MNDSIKLPQSLDDISYDWCLGKPAGYLLTKPPKIGGSKHGSVQYRCSVNKKQHAKMFSMTNKINEEAATQLAIDYGIQWSKDNGHTRNMIRRLHDGIHWKGYHKNLPLTNNTLEIYIDEDNSMLIDFEDLHYVQAHTICKRKASKDNAPYYAMFSFKGTREEKINKDKEFCKNVHNFITGYTMVDHINRNPMDNRRCNLHDTNHKENNNNRTCLSSGMAFAPEHIEKVPGVRFVHDRYQGAWQARIKQDDVEHTRSYSVKQYGYDEACLMAVNARKELGKQFQCNNS